MTKMKKLMLSLTIAFTMAIAFVVGFVGLKDKGYTNTPAQEMGEVSKPTTRTYLPGEVEFVQCAQGQGINYSYTPDVNAKNGTVKAYEYCFTNVADETMAINLKSIDKTGVNVNYAVSETKLTDKSTITGSEVLGLQKLSSKGSVKYIYVLVEPTDVEIPVTFTTSVVWYLGKPGTISIYNPDTNRVTTQEIVKGQEVEGTITAPTPSAGYTFSGWYLDKECTIPVPEGYRTQGQPLFPKFAVDGNLPSDWIAWDEASSSYKMIDPYGYYAPSSHAYYTTNPGPFSDLPDELVIPHIYNDGVHGEAPVTAIPNGIEYESALIVYKSIFALKGTNVTSITIPSSVTNIPNGAFMDANITTFNLPNTIKTVGVDAFDENTNYVTYNGAKYIGSTSNPYMILLEDKNSSTANIHTNTRAIAGKAFAENHNLNRVNFPQGLVSIGDYAFYYCDGLTSADLSACASLEIIGDCAFEGSVISSVTITSSVTTIGNSAFQTLTSLNSVDFNNASSLVNVGDSVFYSQDLNGTIDLSGCTSLTYIPRGMFDQNVAISGIVLPSNITSIGANAFRDCSSLTSVVIPDSVITIGDNAFADSGLQNITLSQNLTSIGNSAFSYTSLASLTIPNKVEKIGQYAFESAGITSLTLNGAWYRTTSQNDWNNMQNGTETDVSNATTTATLLTSTYSNCYWYRKDPEGNLPSDWIAWDEDSSSYHMIDPYGTYVYFDEENWMNETIVANPGPFSALPNDLIIPAFYDDGTHGEAPITQIPAGIANMDTGLVWESILPSNLTSIVVPYTVTSIPDMAFAGLSKLKTVTLPNTITSFGDYSFYCSGVTTVNFPTSLTHFGEEVFWCSYLTTADLSGCTGLQTIPYHTFSDCSLTSVSLPEGLISIGSSAFYCNQSLSSVSLPSTLISIGSSAFEVCESLTGITLPEGLKTIESSAFSATGLTTITLPDSLISLGSGAFDGTSISYNTFYNAYYLPSNTNPDFALIKAISTDITDCPISEDTKVIAGGAFSGCTNLSNITLPGSITSIESSTFSNCKSLTSIIIPSSVTSIGSSAFYGCEALRSVTFSPNIESLGSSAFGSCYALTYIDLSSCTKLTTLPQSVFNRTYSLISVELPETITKIDSGAFEYSGVMTIILPSSLTSINSRAFDYCYRLVEVYNLSNVSISNGSNIGRDVILKGLYTNLNTTSKIQTINNMQYYVDGTDFIALGLADTTITSITLDSRTTAIHRYAFYINKKLSSVNLTNCTSLKSIGYYSFGACSALTSITIPASVKTIGRNAFSSSGLTSVTFKQTSGWYRTTSATSAGSSLTVSNASTAATYLKTTYSTSFWYNTNAGGSYRDYQYQY